MENKKILKTVQKIYDFTIETLENNNLTFGEGCEVLANTIGNIFYCLCDDIGFLKNHEIPIQGKTAFLEDIESVINALEEHGKQKQG
jgi:hypothetical protein